MTEKRLVALGDLLAGQRQAQEAQGVADPAVLVLEGQPVPVGHDDLGGGAQPEGEPARGGVGDGGHALGQQRRAPGVGGGDGHAEVELGLPGGGQCERGEAVGAVDLGRPHVGVAELAQAGEPLLWACSGIPSKGMVMP